MSPRYDPISNDPRVVHAWEAFAADYSQTLLSTILIHDTAADNPAYFTELYGRLLDTEDAFKQRLMIDDDPDLSWDTPVDVPSPLGNPSARLSPDEIDFLLRTITSTGRYPDDFLDRQRALLAVALHSSLEGFLHAVRPDVSAKPLPQAIRPLWDTPKPPPPVHPEEATLGPREAFWHPTVQAFDRLRELDAVRHIVVHNRSVVDEHYLRRVPASNLTPGEFRVVTSDDLWEWLLLVYNAAYHLRCVAV